MNRLVALALLTLTFAVTASDDAPEFTYDGLQLVEGTEADLVYTRPGADFSRYEQFMLAAPGVAFRKNWERDQKDRAGHRINEKDLQRIRERASDLFLEVFVQELEEGGFSVVDDGGADVLVIIPAIVDLDVTAPDVPTAGRSRSYTTGAGSATLVLELHDSTTGQVLARAVDHKRARETSHFQMTSAATNRQEARRAFRSWARMLVTRLQDIQER